MVTGGPAPNHGAYEGVGRTPAQNGHTTGTSTICICAVQTVRGGPYPHAQKWGGMCRAGVMKQLRGSIR